CSHERNAPDTEAIIDAELAEQATPALRYVLTVLAAAGGGPVQVAKLTVYLHAEAHPQVGFAAVQQVCGPHPTAITVLRVVGFARPEALVEIEAIAALPWRAAPHSPGAVS